MDEVGRGALAGPVTVGAVILTPGREPSGLDDSKRLTAAVRQRLDGEIRAAAVAWSLGACSAEEVDTLGIVEATRTAMRRAVNGLAVEPACVICDALAPSGLSMPVLAEIRADSRYLCVAAASIVAKVARDAEMRRLAGECPGYDWERNKGYGTASHLDAIRRLGPSHLHRRSFAPIRVLAFDSGRASGSWPR